ncbi:MAG: hypothetical protein EP329_19500 [Deltaproteobacteria bacterium]|nr:MAG: hypothetical protein EP329_19500 [Deltaproteobacteria bacterium]
MNKRLLVILGVFAGGFGLGYALTWILVSEPAPADGSSASGPVAAVSDGAIPAAGGSPTAGSDGTVSGTVVVDPEAEGDAGGTDPVADGAAAGEAVGTVDDGGSEPVAGAGDPGGEPSEAGGEDPGGAAGEPEKAGPWWEVCKGQTCAMDFGRVTGSVSLRAGKIEDGDEIVWRDTFAKAERVGSVPARDGLKVQLHAVGLEHKLPVAAWITFEDGGKELTGVMALNIGEKVIKMVPIAP